MSFCSFAQYVSFSSWVRGQITLCVHFLNQLNILQDKSDFGYIY